MLVQVAVAEAADATALIGIGRGFADSAPATRYNFVFQVAVAEAADAAALIGIGRGFADSAPATRYNFVFVFSGCSGG